MNIKKLTTWYNAVPLLAAIYYFMHLTGSGMGWDILGAVFLFASVSAAVHHAEIIAARAGEPLGTILLAVSITILEVGLIISFMLSGSAGAETYARDTVYSAVMLILTGILGLSLLIGAWKYREQFFLRSSATTYFVALVMLTTLTLVLPNFTVSEPGAGITNSQLILLSLICLIVYGTFLAVQTIRHRDYFIASVPLPAGQQKTEQDEAHPTPTKTETGVSLLLLAVSLFVVIFMAKGLSGIIEHFVEAIGATKSMVGVLIACIVLLPEGLAAVKAAINHRFQVSVNLALGSALASIALTIPAVSIVCLIFDLPVVWGLPAKSILLLMLAMFMGILTLSRGKTNILFGVALLCLLLCFLFLQIVP